MTPRWRPLVRPPSLIVEAIVTDKKGAPAEDVRVTDSDQLVLLKVIDVRPWHSRESQMPTHSLSGT
jgi:hypothetical protein